LPGNVTEAQLKAYLGALHASYLETVDEYVKEEEHRPLFPRLSLLDRRLVGYVSTTFGVGYEYFREAGRISTERSSKRVEDMFVKAPPWIRRTPALVNFSGTSRGDVAYASFKGRFPFRLHSEAASVSFRGVVFRVGQWFQLVEFAEIFGDRRAENWTDAKAVGRAKDEVFQGILVIERAERKSLSLDDYLTAFKQRTVLCLGDFGVDGRSRLEAVQSALRDLGYDPIRLDELPEFPEYNLVQKAVAVGSVAKFIVVEDSSPSGHLVEFNLVQDNNWIAIVLREEGRRSTWMTAGAQEYSTVLRERTYLPGRVAEVLREEVQWAEKRVQELGPVIEELYPWRRPQTDTPPSKNSK
jgi:hypothetical protein